MSTVVYKYGVRRPTANAALIDEQMRLAHRYLNRLIEIERERRGAVRMVLGRRDIAIKDVVLAAESMSRDLKSATDVIKVQRASTRSRSETKEQRDLVADLRVRSKIAWAVVKEERAARRTENERENTAQAIKEINACAGGKEREARAICGVPWGTYQQIEAAMDASKKMPLWRQNERTHVWEESDPRFRRWDGRGTVGVHIQNRVLGVGEALRCTDKWVQLQIKEPRSSSRNAQKRRFGILRLRVGTEAGAPVWAEWPILMHRPLPDGATISWATVKREMVSDLDQWALHLTLQLPDGMQREKCGEGAVAVDIGWRLMDDGGVRVAYMRDDDGVEREVRVDPGVLSGLRKVEDLASIRDKTMNAMMTQLGPWLEAHTGMMPAPMFEEIRHFAKWRAPGRFVALLRRWEEERWDGDEEGFGMLHAWQYGSWREDIGRYDGGDQHLWRWREHQRKKSLRRRKDRYRVLGAELARRYAVLIIEDFDLRPMQSHKAPESEEVEIAAVRLRQRDAATSELRGCLIQAFVSRGGRVVKVDPAMTTQIHFECGYDGRWDAAPQVDHTCEGCGETFDQDANAAKNIMRLFRERPGGGEEPVAKVQAKWAKRGRHNGAARKDVTNYVESQEI